jgi:hypothetical protein
MVFGGVEYPGALGVLAHVAGPVGDNAPVRVAVPRTALQPRRARKALLHLPVACGLHFIPHVDRGCVPVPNQLRGLPNISGLRLELEDDLAT